MKNNNEQDFSKQVCSFRLGEGLYGIPVIYLKEICSEFEFTPVYHSSNSIAGLVNVRGKLYLIADPKKMMKIPGKTNFCGKRLLLFKERSLPSFGILTGEMADIIDLTGIAMENFNFERVKTNQSEVNIIEGLFQLKKEVLILLDPFSIYDFFVSLKNNDNYNPEGE